MRLRLPRLRLLLRRRMRERPPRGNMSNVIVVKAPAPCFREALFILRDDYLGDAGQNREALLLQAREAAASFTGPAAPPPPRRFLWLLPLLGLLAALVLRLCGLW